MHAHTNFSQLLLGVNGKVFIVIVAHKKPHFHHLATAMAINLQRFVHWVWNMRVLPRFLSRCTLRS